MMNQCSNRNCFYTLRWCFNGSQMFRRMLVSYCCAPFETVSFCCESTFSNNPPPQLLNAFENTWKKLTFLDEKCQLRIFKNRREDDSKRPFHPLVGGHLSFEIPLKGPLTL